MGARAGIDELNHGRTFGGKVLGGTDSKGRIRRKGFREDVRATEFGGMDSKEGNRREGVEGRVTKDLRELQGITALVLATGFFRRKVSGLLVSSLVRRGFWTRTWLESPHSEFSSPDSAETRGF